MYPRLDAVAHRKRRGRRVSKSSLLHDCRSMIKCALQSRLALLSHHFPAWTSRENSGTISPSGVLFWVLSFPSLSYSIHAFINDLAYFLTCLYVLYADDLKHSSLYRLSFSSSLHQSTPSTLVRWFSVNLTSPSFWPKVSILGRKCTLLPLTFSRPLPR